jgi:threonylcarbamoyladenosine tRNA methylthiotransferase MtaB
VPHFHLPLQSGSDALLRRMNRQYGRDDFLYMVDRVRNVFDRPALSTDVIVGFPGETDHEFRRTLEVVDRAGFVHVHAFPFSPRPGTAAARWGDQFVRRPVVIERMEMLCRRAAEHGLAFRRQFVGATVEVLVEDDDSAARHGRCERYFDVRFDDPAARPGDFLRVRVDAATEAATFGTCLGPAGAAGEAA